MPYDVVDAQISPTGRLEVLSRAEINNLLDRGHDGLRGAVDGSRLVAELGDFGDDLLDEVRGGVRAEDDDHGFFSCGV